MHLIQQNIYKFTFRNDTIMGEMKKEKMNRKLNIYNHKRKLILSIFKSKKNNKYKLMPEKPSNRTNGKLNAITIKYWEQRTFCK